MSIEVHVRVRPGVANPVWSSAETVLYSTANANTRYVYNKVHPSNSSNLSIFQGIEAIVHAAFDGKNVTIMAYGQTGSGKTHSMVGTDTDAGIIPRTAKLLLDLKRIHPGTRIEAYYTEIYNESVKDLLEPQRGELALHDAPDGGVTFEKRMVQVESFEDFLKLQSAAERNRKYGVTNLNEHSSRSHIMLTFEIHRTHRTQKSVINLVDLAGSESAARANTEGTALREGGFINRSLLTLGNVVDAIVDRRPYVPYRDAKLTRILRTCLGGSGITLILCCVSPSRENYEQTIAALRFTQRAMRIKKDPVVALSMPPLFTHQYAAGAAELVSGLQESADAEYQRGLRDAYMYCSGTAGAVVANFQNQVSDSMHALANAQRLLVAHDHAMGMNRVGRLYHLMNELTRQKVKSHDLLESERKRQRDVADDIGHRKEKLAKLETQLTEREAAADTHLAGWEYQLHEARQGQLREADLLFSAEEARRARIGYEWAVCVERIATRYVPALIEELSAATTTAAALAATEGSGGGHHLQQELGDGAVVCGASKAVALQQLRERLAKARAEVEDLRSAYEMVRDDVEQARRTQEAKSASQKPRGHHDDADDAAMDEGQLTMAALARNRHASNAELEEQLASLEEEERQLRAQAKRAIRRESLRRVRESLRRSSRSPQSDKMKGGHGGSYSVTPQANRRSTGPEGDELPENDGVRGGQPNQHRYCQPTCSSARRGRGARSRSGSATTRDSYADGVRNALSVIHSIRTRLNLQQADGSSSSSGAPPSKRPPRRRTPPRHADPAPAGEDAEEGGRKWEATFLEMFGGHLQHPHSPDEKENHRGNQSPAPPKGIRSSSSTAKTRIHGAPPYSKGKQQLEMVVEDDEAFVTSSMDQPSLGETTPPIIGIAARRKWDRQRSDSNPPPQASRPDVERTLYPLLSNSQSTERHSRSRR